MLAERNIIRDGDGAIRADEKIIAVYVKVFWLDFFQCSWYNRFITTWTSISRNVA